MELLVVGKVKSFLRVIRVHAHSTNSILLYLQLHDGVEIGRWTIEGDGSRNGVVSCYIDLFIKSGWLVWSQFNAQKCKPSVYSQPCRFEQEVLGGPMSLSGGGPTVLEAVPVALAVPIHRPIIGTNTYRQVTLPNIWDTYTFHKLTHVCAYHAYKLLFKLWLWHGAHESKPTRSSEFFDYFLQKPSSDHLDYWLNWYIYK